MSKEESVAIKTLTGICETPSCDAITKLHAARAILEHLRTLEHIREHMEFFVNRESHANRI